MYLLHYMGGKRCTNYRETHLRSQQAVPKWETEPKVLQLLVLWYKTCHRKAKLCGFSELQVEVP